MSVSVSLKTMVEVANTSIHNRAIAGGCKLYMSKFDGLPDGPPLIRARTVYSSNVTMTDIVKMCCTPILFCWHCLEHRDHPNCCSGPQACKMLPMISVSVEMTQCASNKCGQYGTCQLYDEATTVFAACECFYGMSLCLSSASVDHAMH